jgi:hypothetical protein
MRRFLSLASLARTWLLIATLLTVKADKSDGALTVEPHATIGESHEASEFHESHADVRDDIHSRSHSYSYNEASPRETSVIASSSGHGDDSAVEFDFSNYYVISYDHEQQQVSTR